MARYQKAFDTLITAFRQYRNPDIIQYIISQHIIGEAAQVSALKMLAESGTHIVFPGFHSDPVAAPTGVDVVLMPSRCKTYCPAIIKAIAPGRRLLCQYIDGLCDPANHAGGTEDTADTDEITKLITGEANADVNMNKWPVVRTTRRLENRFCDCWRFIPSEIAT